MQAELNIEADTSGSGSMYVGCQLLAVTKLKSNRHWYNALRTTVFKPKLFFMSVRYVFIQFSFLQEGPMSQPLYKRQAFFFHPIYNIVLFPLDPPGTGH